MKYSMLLGILALDLEPLYAERAKQRMIKAGSKGGSVTKEQIFAKGRALGPHPCEHSIPKSDLEPLYAERATQRRIEGNKRGGSVTSENASVTKSVALGPPTYNKDVE